MRDQGKAMMIDLNPVIFKPQLWLGAENKVDYGLHLFKYVTICITIMIK